ncbi:MAG: MFS transporter, partial [Chloroflexota bacterium]
MSENGKPRSDPEQGGTAKQDTGLDGQPQEHAAEEEPRRFLGMSVPPAMRFPQYRNYWLGMFAAVGGFQMFMFTQFWLGHELTGSPAFLGFVGAANAIPAIILNLAGGVVADRFDQRRLIMTTETVAALLVALLAGLALFGVAEPWHILVVAVFAGAVNAFNQPARMALYPHLIERSVLMSAVAMNSSVWQGNRIVAPAVAGALIALTDNAASALFVAALGMLTMAFVVSRLSVPNVRPSRQQAAYKDMLEGLRFIRRNGIFSFLIGMTFFSSFFGLSYVPLMPVFAVDILEAGADGQGMLVSISGIGSLGITLWMSTRATSRRKGLILIGGAVAMGLSLIAFSLTSHFVGWFPLAMGLMFILFVIYVPKGLVS